VKYTKGAEISKGVLDALHHVDALTENELSSGFSRGCLGEFDIQLNYVPIIMSADKLDRFPARSRAYKAKKRYACCPQLDYDAFVSGTPAERVAIYLDGLRGCGPGLAKLGATPEQVAEFDRILDDTLQIVTERLNRSTQT
jgi:hypothetical protein